MKQRWKLFSIGIGWLLFVIIVLVAGWGVINVLTGLVTVLAAIQLVEVSRCIISSYVISDDTDDSAQLRSTRERTCAKQIEVFIVCIAAVGGLYALNAYRETNSIATRAALEQRDSATRAIYRDNENKRLMRVFVNDPDDKKTNYKDCDPETRRVIQEWAKKAVVSIMESKHAREIPPWKDVHALYNNLWSISTRESKGMTDVLLAFFHVVDYLYIVHDAYQARIKDVFTVDEYEMWAAYLEDLGPSPYFLMTILDGHGHGYITKEFSEEIWRRFQKNQRLKCVAQTLYPDLVQDKEQWIRKWGAFRETGVHDNPVNTKEAVRP